MLEPRAWWLVFLSRPLSQKPKCRGLASWPASDLIGSLRNGGGPWTEGLPGHYSAQLGGPAPRWPPRLRSEFPWGPTPLDECIYRSGGPTRPGESPRKGRQGCGEKDTGPPPMPGGAGSPCSLASSCWGWGGVIPRAVRATWPQEGAPWPSIPRLLGPEVSSTCCGVLGACRRTDP